MPRLADFADAHRRHLEDADLLFDNDRWANADRLYGLSAECGLKAVMVELGLSVDARGRPSPKYREHVHRLWPLFVDFVETAAELWSEFPDEAPFDDWSPHDRYAHREHFQVGDVEPHRNAAELIRRMVAWQLQGTGA